MDQPTGHGRQEGAAGRPRQSRWRGVGAAGGRGPRMGLRDPNGAALQPPACCFR